MVVQIKTYQWGNRPNERALLVHGWEGRASNFGKLIPVLVDNGFQVEAFDGPAHGNSEKPPNPFLDFVDLVNAKLSPSSSYDLIVTHSMGSILTLWALSQSKLPVEQMIICSTPDRFEDRVQTTIDALGLTAKTKLALMDILHQRTGVNPWEVNGSDFVQSVNIKEALFIQDEGDRIIPWLGPRKCNNQPTTQS